MTATHGFAIGTPVHREAWAAVLAQPDRDWNVHALAERLPGRSRGGLRTALHLLMAERAVVPVKGHVVLTVRMARDGAAIVADLLAAWDDAHGRRT